MSRVLLALAARAAGLPPAPGTVPLLPRPVARFEGEGDGDWQDEPAFDPSTPPPPSVTVTEPKGGAGLLPHESVRSGPDVGTAPAASASTPAPASAAAAAAPAPSVRPVAERPAASAVSGEALSSRPARAAPAPLAGAPPPPPPAVPSAEPAPVPAGPAMTAPPPVPPARARAPAAPLRTAPPSAGPPQVTVTIGTIVVEQPRPPARPASPPEASPPPLRTRGFDDFAARRRGRLR